MKHRTHNSFLILLIAVLVLFSGCSNLFNMLFEPVQQSVITNSILTVQINDGSSKDSMRVIAPLASGLVYTVSLYKGADDAKPAVKTNLAAADKISFESLESGKEYIVRVIGENSAGLDILSGEAKFTAKDGENAVRVNTSLARGSGTGNLYLRYAFSENAYADFEIELKTFSDELITDFTGEGEASFNEESGLFILDKKGIPAGTYILSISYYTLEGVRYLPIDPLVEIYTGCTSSTKDPIPVDISVGSAARIVYAASTEVSGNTGRTSLDPVTLDKAIQIINEDSSLTGDSYAMILLTQHISLKNTVINPAIQKNIVILPGTYDETLNITFNGIRDTVFTVGTESVTGGLILSGINIGSESETFYAAQGLIKVDNGTLYFDESVALQYNKIPLYTSEEPYTLTKGGAITLSPQGSLHTDGGLIQGCSAGMGGAVYAEGGEVPGNFESLFLSNLEINSCASALGGAMYSFGRNVDAVNLTITGCTATEDLNAEDGGYGGGIYIDFGMFTLMGGSITGCTADPASNSEKVTKGGAVYTGADGILNILSGFPLGFAENDAQKGYNIFIENYSLSSIQFNGVTPSDYADFETKIVNSTSQGIEQGYYNEHLFKGTGVPGDEYQVSNRADLEGIRYITESGKLFKQTATIDLAGVGDFRPIPEFSGTYDGNGYKISNLSIAGLDSDCDNIGLFSNVNGGTLKNIILENADIFIANVAPNYGALAGQIITTTIENCGVTGEINFFNETLAYENCGGLVGSAGNSSISGSFCAANINAPYIGNVGGLVGYVYDEVTGTVITNCYTSMPSVTGNQYCGALVGYVYPGSYAVSVTNTYSTAVPSGANRNFIGYAEGSPVLTNTYSTDFIPNGDGFAAASQKTIDEIALLTSIAFGDTVWSYYTDGLSFPSLNWHAGFYKPYLFRVESIEFNNGSGSEGTLNPNDLIVITFSLPVEPLSIHDSLGLIGSLEIASSDLTIMGASSTTDTLAFAGNKVTDFHIGTFELEGSEIVSSTGSADCQLIYLSADAKTLYIQINTVSGLSFNSLDLNEYIRFYPSSNIRSSTNQPVFDSIYASIGENVSLF